jgi:maltose-binding protein MalE
MKTPDSAPEQEAIHEARLWQDNGWTARVIKNEDDDGWAVSMTPDGQAEPALTGPWTMGRDKKNPKPLDTAAFNTLVKTAAEFVRRHEQQLHATLHQEVIIAGASGRISVTLDIVADDDNPSAVLRATDASGEMLAEARVSPGFKLTRASATAWADAEFSPPSPHRSR